MKMNCQLYTAQKAFDTIFRYVPKGKITNVRFSVEGYLLWMEDDKPKSMSAIEVACEINMPLWEVVTVDNNGSNDYGLLLFKE